MNEALTHSLHDIAKSGRRPPFSGYGRHEGCVQIDMNRDLNASGLNSVRGRFFGDLPAAFLPAKFVFLNVYVYVHISASSHSLRLR